MKIVAKAETRMQYKQNIIIFGTKNPGMSKANKSSLKKNPSRLIKSIKTQTRYSPLKTEENPNDSKNTRTNSLKKVIAKQNLINIATENIQNSNDEAEIDTPDKTKLPVTVILYDSMVKDTKGWKISSRTHKVVVKHFSGAKTNMKSYIIPTVKQKTDDIILHTGTNDLKNVDTPEEITMGFYNLAVTCKTDTISVFISGIVPRPGKFNEKVN